MTLDLGVMNIVLLTLTAIATVYVCFQSCLRSGFKPNTVATELLRFLLIGLAAFTLLQPSFSFQSEPSAKSVVKVLMDVSESMDTADVERDGKLMARSETIEALGSDETWPSIGDDKVIEVESFASPQIEEKSSGEASEETADAAEERYNRAATDINERLQRIAESPGNVKAVVLATDGDWNIGKSPSSAARKLRQLGISVHTIGAGSPVALPDLKVDNFDLPTFAILGKPLRIPFAITSTLPTPVDVDVTIALPGNKSKKVPLQVPAGGTKESVISWKPEEIGNFEITVSIPQHPDEKVVTNNQVTLPINVRYEALRVLMIDTFPRWEYRYTRNALMRDPGVTVSTLLLHPDFDGNGGGPGYLDEFPKAAELEKFDAIFIGDVGVGEKQLTFENCEAIAAHVRNRAAGLIFLPGFRGYQATLADSDLEDLLPVELDAEQPTGIRSPTPASFQLTEAGSQSLLTRLKTKPEENVALWKVLPGFFWHAPVVRAKPNSNVLAVHSSSSNRFGRLPMIVTRTWGTGKVLFVGTDSAWRWRKGVEDLYHYRFWSQMVRWMAYQRTMASGDSMRLIFTPDRPRTGDTVNVLVNAMDSNGEPLQQGTLITQVIMPSGSIKTLNLRSDSKDSWGLFRNSFVADEGGQVKLITSCRETNTQLETQLSVRGVPREQLGQPARLNVLQEIASITNGQAINAKDNDWSVVQTAIRELPPTAAIKQQYQLWCHPLWGLMMIVLLGVFWTLRKFQGLI